MVIDQKAEQEIHRRQLYITDAVFNLCTKHDINCFLVGGSLLGAVKEKGILKGDKDVDIGMPRDDYERFCQVASELPDDLCFLEARIDTNCNWLFAKVYQKGTRLIPKEPPLFGPTTGIYVDINPYDFVSEDDNRRKGEYRSAKLKKWLLLLKGEPSKSDLRIKLMSILGKTQTRDKLIRYFAKGRKRTSVVQNIVGGTEKDWFSVEEISDLQLVKGFKLPRKPNTEYAERLIAANHELGKVLAENLQGALPAIALDGHPALSTAYMNDCEPLLCFAQQVNGFGRAGDVFLGISTSGNSKNILYAATVAKAKGMKIVGLTGANDSRLAEIADVCVQAPQTETYMIQELHLPIYHCWCLMLEESFFGE